MRLSSQSSRVSVRRAVLKTLTFLIVAGLLASAWHWRSAWYSQRAQSTSAQQTAQLMADQAAVPIDVAVAEREDFPVYLNGLGYRNIDGNGRLIR